MEKLKELGCWVGEEDGIVAPRTFVGGKINTKVSKFQIKPNFRGR